MTTLATLGRARQLDMGKPETVAGTWKFPVPKTHYTLIYAETSEAICILHCWHQSRRSTLEYG